MVSVKRIRLRMRVRFICFLNFRILVTIAKLGVAITNLMSPLVYSETQSLFWTLSIGTLLSSIGIIACYAFVRIDLENEKR